MTCIHGLHFSHLFVDFWIYFLIGIPGAWVAWEWLKAKVKRPASK
jgi:hypothetical protein